MDEPTPVSPASQLAARLGGLAREASEAAYQPPQLDALWVEIEHKTTRRRPSWALAAAACAACLVTGGLISWAVSQGDSDSQSDGESAVASNDMHNDVHNDAQPIAQPPTPREPTVHEGRIELPDGSLALALDDATDLSWTRDAGGTTVTLAAGTAVFDVAAQPEGQSFRVRAADAEIEVIGTRFTVAHVEDGVDVAVAFGRVAVHAPHQQTVLLGAGESAHIDEVDRVGLEPVAALGQAEARPDPRADVAPMDLPAPRHEEPPSVDALLDRADAARKKGEHAAAAAALQTVLDEHPRDSQAALAAYTLGRIQLSDLDRPRQAAKAFAKARALAPKGTMAEDALAKEIESWAAAGRETKAEAAAGLYLERYPKGRWKKLAQRYAAP